MGDVGEEMKGTERDEGERKGQGIVREGKQSRMRREGK